MRSSLDLFGSGSSLDILLLKNFALWWWREISCLCRACFGGRSALSKVLHIDLDEGTFWYGEQSTRRAIPNWPGDVPPDAIANLVQSIIPNVTPAGLAIRHPDVMETEMSAPSIARKNLSEFVGYELDRYFPVPPETISSAYDFIGQSKDGASIRLALSACRREHMDFAVQLAQELDCDLLYFGSNLQDQQQRNLAAHVASPEFRPALRWKAALLTLLLLASLAVILVGQADRRHALEQQLAEAQTTAQSESDAKTAIRQRLGWMEAIAQNQPRVLDALNVVVPAIGGNGAINYLAWEPDSFEIAGRTPDAAATIRLLAAHPLFGAIEYLSPVQAAPEGDYERFHLKVFLNGSAGESDAAD